MTCLLVNSRRKSQTTTCIHQRNLILRLKTCLSLQYYKIHITKRIEQFCNAYNLNGVLLQKFGFFSAWCQSVTLISIQFQFKSSLLPYCYIWNTESTKDKWKLQQNDTMCLLHVMKFELTQNTKNKIRLGVEQQGNPLFWFWRDTERI